MDDNKITAIQVRGLAKRFGEVEAVSGVDFEVLTGELFGFLGPNGAGKTTTINMLTGLAHPDAPAIPGWPSISSVLSRMRAICTRN